VALVPHVKPFVKKVLSPGYGPGEWVKGTQFFFSSRRRHTRLVSDWSSDVCSSDLAGGGHRAAPGRAGRAGHPGSPALPGRVGVRSEERRVGKECRCRWPPYR